MKNWTYIFAAGLFCMALFACQSNDPNHLAEDQLRDEIMVVHDEVMPKMGDLHRLKKELKKIASSEEIPGDDPIAAMIRRIDAADEAMMSWMSAFRQPAKLRGELTHDEIMAYLTEQKLEMVEVKEKMLSAIADATTLVESYSKAQ